MLGSEAFTHVIEGSVISVYITSKATCKSLVAKENDYRLFEMRKLELTARFHSSICCIGSTNEFADLQSWIWVGDLT